MSLTQTLITNYEAHLEANWTREGERKPSTFGMAWKDVLPHVWMQDQLTADNIAKTYSKPLPSFPDFIGQ